MSGALLEMNDRLYAYLDAVSDREPAVLAELREETHNDPRFNMAVAPMQGQFMGVLVRALGARRIVEVGTYTGYSSLSMALALPDDGRMWCFDISEEWTGLAQKYWRKAGVADRIELRLAPGEESMDALVAEGHGGSIDLVFIDADKPNYHKYWERGLTLLRRGGLMIADNTLFQGVVSDDYDDERLKAHWAHRPKEILPELVGNTHAIRAFNEQIHKDDRVELSMIPVGDGMTLAVKK